MFFDIYWFLNGSRDILCHVQSPYKMSHLSPFTCQQNIRIPDVDISKLDKQKLNQSSPNPRYRSRNQWTVQENQVCYGPKIWSDRRLVRSSLDFNRFKITNYCRLKISNFPRFWNIWSNRDFRRGSKSIRKKTRDSKILNLKSD